MVITEKEEQFRQMLEALLDEEDQAHDGWGPVQPRRSSMPAPLSTQAESDDALQASAKNTNETAE